MIRLTQRKNHKQRGERELIIILSSPVKSPRHEIKPKEENTIKKNKPTDEGRTTTHKSVLPIMYIAIRPYYNNHKNDQNMKMGKIRKH